MTLPQGLRLVEADHLSPDLDAGADALTEVKSDFQLAGTVRRRTRMTTSVRFTFCVFTKEYTQAEHVQQLMSSTERLAPLRPGSIHSIAHRMCPCPGKVV